MAQFITQEQLADTLCIYRVVMMCGVSGSGKTRFARMLENEGFVRVSVDEIIWDKYGQEFASLPFAQQQPAFAEANALMENTVAELLGQGKSVVVDSTMCSASKRQRMHRLCARFGAKAATLHLPATLPTLISRMALRKGLEPNDQIVAPELLARFVSGFEAPTPDEPLVFSLADGDEA